MGELINVEECFVSKWVNEKDLYNYCDSFVKEVKVKTPGVYYIYKDDVLLYVGNSINIRSRLRDHLVRNTNSESFINEATKIRYIVVKDKDERDLKEYREIRDLKPLMNKKLPNLTKKQKEILKEESE